MDVNAVEHLAGDALLVLGNSGCGTGTGLLVIDYRHSNRKGRDIPNSTLFSYWMKDRRMILKANLSMQNF
jgi:hypothetical protein